MQTPVGVPLGEKISIEIKKLREMSFKEKLEYIWEYYKFHIIGIAVALLIIGGLMNTWFFNPKPEAALFISWNSGFTTDEQRDELQEFLQELLIEGNENKEVIISYVLMNENDPTLAMVNVQRIVAMVAGGTIDIFILDAERLEENTKNGFLQPIEGILAEVQKKNAAVYEIIKENTAIELYELEEDVFSERIMGINVKSSPLLSELEFIGQELYLSVSITSEKTENIIKTLIALFEEK